MPVSAHDVAAYILSRKGEMSAMKLQKLLYYSQAWSLVWDDAPLFSERIEAWMNGPVVRDVYERHRGKFLVAEWPDGDASKLDENQSETVDVVVGYYGDHNAQQLSDLTHRENPWIVARHGLAEDERGEREIPLDSMAEYYSSLQ
jgi:uncharacterized phage-associated protein